MKSDSFFCIGKTHKVNQDYAISGISKGGFTYAIVSDGCSSSPDTDFGSRLLARAAITHIDKIYNTYEFATSVIYSAAFQSSCIGLNIHALDATLLVAAQINNKVHVLMLGDGVICVKTKSVTEIIKANYPNNAPYYMSYLVNSKNKADFFKQFNDKLESGHQLYESNLPYDINASVFDTESFPWIHLQCDTDDVDYVALMSDGVESFSKTITTDTSITSEAIPYTEVVENLLSFKGRTGEFVKRRAARTVKNYFNDHTYNNDDLSIAVLSK